MASLRQEHQKDKLLFDMLTDIKIRLDPEQTSCLICGKSVNVLKTDHKTCYSSDIGKFKLISASSYCPDHKYLGEKNNQILRYESNLAALIVDKGYRVTFDLVVKIGRLRYEDHRQLREIQSFLKCSSAKLDLQISTIGMIAKRFLEFCQLLHQSRETEIRESLVVNGGYFLHFDGSTEQKSGKCSLVLVDSRSGLILDSQMVESERSDIIVDALTRAKEKYGKPLAIISDLRSGFVAASTSVFGSQISHILCHYHFLRTFSDEFKKDHAHIGVCVTKKWQVQAKLKKQLKKLPNLKLNTEHPNELKTIDRIEDYWRDTKDTLGAYRFVLRWILNYRQDSSGKSLPFDLPYIDLYNRFIAGKKLIELIFADPSVEGRQKYYRHGFCSIVEATKVLGHQEPGFRKALHQLEYQRKWFNKLRAVLFMEAQVVADRSLAPLSKTYQLSKEEAKKLPLRLKGFLASLEKEFMRCKHPARKAFLEKLRKQVEKYHNHLNVPILAITANGEKIVIVPPRTNNYLESLFRYIKTVLRRCTGRSKLPREFGSVGALLPYFMTMKDHLVFRQSFADDRLLAEEFAKLFITPWQPPENLITLPVRSEKTTENGQLAALGG